MRTPAKTNTIIYAVEPNVLLQMGLLLRIAALMEQTMIVMDWLTVKIMIAME